MRLWFVFAFAVVAVSGITAPQARAGDTAGGQQSFTMPSGNIECVYTPKGGVDGYMPASGGPELECDRDQPSYLRVNLSGNAPAAIIKTDERGCCSGDFVLEYGRSWKMDGYACVSERSGLTCTRGRHGFTLARKGTKLW